MVEVPNSQANNDVAAHPFGPASRRAGALALALEAELVLIDDAEGRREAKRLGIRMTGTVGVLALAEERRLVGVRDVVSRLRGCGFYVDEKVLTKAFGSWL